VVLAAADRVCNQKPIIILTTMTKMQIKNIKTTTKIIKTLKDKIQRGCRKKMRIMKAR
jgi:hypothetical protein